MLNVFWLLRICNHLSDTQQFSVEQNLSYYYILQRWGENCHTHEGESRRLDMADEELCFFTLQQLAECISTRQVSPLEVVQAHVARCERLNPTLQAFVTLTPELALQAAEQAERDISAGAYRGPLHGIPVGLKDIGTWSALPVAPVAAPAPPWRRFSVLVPLAPTPVARFVTLRRVMAWWG
jgi:hypothetical protein